MHKHTKQQKEQRVIANYLRFYSWLISPKSCTSWIYHVDKLSALERNIFILKGVLMTCIIFKNDHPLIMQQWGKDYI